MSDQTIEAAESASEIFLVREHQVAQRPLVSYGQCPRKRKAAQPAFGPDGFTYQERRLALDVNFEYQIRKEMFLFFTAQNVFNEPYITQIYGSQTPDRKS